jgi:hypothetical protein
MCNCGKKRTAFKQQRIIDPNLAAVVPQQNSLQSIQPVKTVMFQYTGNTALSVIGNVTRKSYRFGFPGDIQHITLSDAAGMAAIPVLKRI